ncbi:hypothetical protein PV08_10448 [Exophiala spinifera]|uniref:ABC transporter domain-containing protein n=1 Tax=Exophiala spinifera TaxID=91928 RepID=A0A0D2AWS3_9EURO|nr:uncharacterized protein PV08_10448 [Exophiala spinifera]KIW11148.1 hypothetical protein PV08_10448 [Exophiala spinifera]
MAFSVFLYQTWALFKKNILIVVRRHWFSTLVRALILPILYILLISYVRNFFLPPSKYGFGEPNAIRTPASAFAAQSSRDRIVLINNNYAGGLIEAAIDHLSSTYLAAGADVKHAASESDLSDLCRSSLTGTTRCYGAVSFWGSPGDSGSDSHWDFSAYTDWALGSRVHVNQDKNDAQVYALPFVHAINSAIANVSGRHLTQDVLQYPFTSQTFQQRQDQVQGKFMSALEHYLALVIFIAMCGITYHLPGHIATEREIGMSALIDTMNPQPAQWQSSAARIFAANSAFSLVYMPASIGVGVIIATRIFLRTSVGIITIFHIVTCLSLAGYSALLVSFFSKARLSGITIVVFSCILAVVAQWAVPGFYVAVIVLCLVFPPINYVLFMIYVAAAEGQNEPANFSQASLTARSTLPGYFYLAAGVVQIIIFPLLTLWAERWHYGTAALSPVAGDRLQNKPYALRLKSLSKTYDPSLLTRCLRWKSDETVYAVRDVSFTALRGQLVALLGENGSGKTTTISAITAQEKFTSGTVELDDAGGMGFCPQRNVLWDELTVLEHIKVFDELKAISDRRSKPMLQEMLESCDLTDKADSRTKTLSGGQKRKVQLAMAFTGGSKICCIDEASSGLDPVSRRKVWDILLAERGRRTLLFTTHALDEADALADHIVILQKGCVKLEGSPVELKRQCGGTYKIDLQYNGRLEIGADHALRHEQAGASHTFYAAQSVDAGRLMAILASRGLHTFEIQGPTLEQVFLNQAESEPESVPSGPKLARLQRTDRTRSSDTAEIELLSIHPKSNTNPDDRGNPLGLPDGRTTGFVGQLWFLVRKRLAVFPHNWMPYLFALAIPSITAGLSISFLTGFGGITCSPNDLSLTPVTASISDYSGHAFPVGPASNIDTDRLQNMLGVSASSATLGPGLSPNMVTTDSYPDWNSFLHAQYSTIEPGGFYLGNDSFPGPVMAYRIDGGLQYAAIMMAATDAYLMNTSVSSTFLNFALPIGAAPGDSLQMIIYFGLAMSITPGLFALYPSFERTRNVKQLQYSNGVRPGPLWLGHLLFDGIFVVAISTISLIVFTQAKSSVWHFTSYLWPVFFFYGLSATLLAYIFSLFVSIQLGAFAFAAGYQAISLLLYLIVYLVMVAFSVADDLQTNLNTIQYILGLFMPSGSLLRALLLGLNQSQLLCQGSRYRAPGSMSIYGAPIVYLALQCVVFYIILVSCDSGLLASLGPRFKKIYSSLRTSHVQSSVKQSQHGPDVLAETQRAENSPGDALRVLHVSKSFSAHNPVVSDLTFGVKSSECFALLGPNGAGKTTTFSLIRGQTQPSQTASSPAGDVLVDGHSLLRQRADALLSLGVCPQFDAIDMLTVSQHLRFYARAAGIPPRLVEPTVTHIMQVVGLEQYSRRLATTLSGGNKRKMSLAIAVIGNPKVLLLDEPSSGLDAVSKRVMWKALDAVRHMSRDRQMAIMITTHSMEEVVALADRVGIMNKHMLAVGERRDLSRRYGTGFHVHVMLGRSTSAEAEETMAKNKVKDWIQQNVPGAVVEREMLHGQLRFWIPRHPEGSEGSTRGDASVLATTFRLLETSKQRLGIEYYTIVQTDWEDIFLNVIRQDQSSGP